MRRRQFLAALGAGVGGWPRFVRGQTGRKWRIGYLSGAATPPSIEHSIYGGFLQGMRELGYVEGRDFSMEWRFAEARPERYVEFAAELVRLNVDLVVAGAPQAIRPVQSAAPKLPIVLAVATDPVGNGWAESLAHPGGTVTGVSNSVDDTAPKQLELLSAALPGLKRIGLLSNPAGPNAVAVGGRVRAAAQARRIDIVAAEARRSEDLEGALALLAREKVDAVMVVSDVLFNLNRFKVTSLAAQHRLPSMFSIREYAEAGALMSYGESFREFNRRAAAYADKILKGAKPGDLPIEQPNRFFLVINLRTAKLLGIDMPASLVLLADEVIE
jgi:putative ABC transport system substrate-binding protein